MTVVAGTGSGGFDDTLRSFNGDGRLNDTLVLGPQCLELSPRTLQVCATPYETPCAHSMKIDFYFIVSGLYADS